MKLGPSHVPAAPAYERAGIAFLQATYWDTHPEGEGDAPSPWMNAEATDGTR